MLNVSNRFRELIYAPTRRTGARVEFQIVDVTAIDDAEGTVTSEAVISRKDQLFNAVTGMSGRLATFEPNYWKLDGSFSLPPKIDEPGYEVGWWSGVLSDGNGDFTPAQEILIDFSENHSSIGLTIVFDTASDEYASDFDIVVYDEFDNVIHTENVTGNTLAKYILEQGLADYRKILITLKKWGKPQRRARIGEISFGIVEEYFNEDLISLEATEELDTISASAIINEVRFTIENQDKRFDIINPSGIYPFLQRKQKISAFIGVERTQGFFEYAQLGAYYLSEWRSDSGSLTATFTARDILDILDQDEYPETTHTSESLYDIAEQVLASADIDFYFLDEALQDITITATIPSATFREVLQMIAIAGQCVVYSDREGRVVIKRLSEVVLPDKIELDNMYKSPQIRLDKLVNTIYVDVMGTEYTYTDPFKQANDPILSVSIENPLITTTQHAEQVAIWVLDELKKRFIYEVDWRGNPAIETGDILTIEDDFSEGKTVIITKNEFSFSGALRCRSEGRGRFE